MGRPLDSREKEEAEEDFTRTDDDIDRAELYEQTCAGDAGRRRRQAGSLARARGARRHLRRDAAGAIASGRCPPPRLPERPSRWGLLVATLLRRRQGCWVSRGGAPLEAHGRRRRAMPLSQALRAVAKRERLELEFLRIKAERRSFGAGPALGGVGGGGVGVGGNVERSRQKVEARIRRSPLRFALDTGTRIAKLLALAVQPERAATARQLATAVKRLKFVRQCGSSDGGGEPLDAWSSDVRAGGHLYQFLQTARESVSPAGPSARPLQQDAELLMLPGHVAAFIAKMEELRKMGRPFLPCVAFHSTPFDDARVGISQGNFDPAKCGRNDAGYYGRGTYFHTNIACGGAGGRDTFLALILKGREYALTYRLGCPLEPGYDSHIADDRRTSGETVIFSQDQMLPVFRYDC